MEGWVDHAAPGFAEGRDLRQAYTWHSGASSLVNYVLLWRVFFFFFVIVAMLETLLLFTVSLYTSYYSVLEPVGSIGCLLLVQHIEI
jgi:hypothetical protein